MVRRPHRDYLQPHYYASVADAEFPEIDAIMRLGSRLLDAAGVQKVS